LSECTEVSVVREQRYASIEATLSNQGISHTSLAALSEYARAKCACSVLEPWLDLDHRQL
jgi:hypothetical protein